MRYAIAAVALLLCSACGDQKMINKAEQAVLSQMKDPDSAKFKDVSVLTSPTGATYICGFVNGKNSFGGYNGYKQFIYTPSTGNMLIANQGNDEQTREMMTVTVSAICAGKPPA